MDRPTNKQLKFKIAELANQLRQKSSETLKIKKLKSFKKSNMTTPNSSYKNIHIEVDQDGSPMNRFIKQYSHKFSRFSAQLLEKKLENKPIDKVYLRKSTKISVNESPKEKNDLASSNEFRKLITECKKLEEMCKNYEQKNRILKLKVEELEKEKSFLELKLKKTLKEVKLFEELKIKTEEQGKILALKNSLPPLRDSEFVPSTQSGKYLWSLAKKHIPGTQNFYKEIEEFMEYKNYKLHQTIDHYKNIIKNLQCSLKKKSSEYACGVNINNLGRFFAECVEEVKKEVLANRNSTKLLKTDKKNILEKFVLNDNVLNVIYESMIEYQKIISNDKAQELEYDFFFKNPGLQQVEIPSQTLALE
ncbi:hypothetical protein SteCoe_4033 [Stentor coeruleus]|uniref:Uncharacterized protein n=1 Tax=Stentor coeruleus TaxID=5963 RepID=A0A1R2CVQ3_9CILI|nr:hypothetical protein SteCoe_4033 [Stentor coeruleus]